VPDYRNLAGSAGARVEAFFTQTEVPGSTSVGLSWKCPGGSEKTMVRVTLASGPTIILNEQLQCSANHAEWQLSRFQQWKDKPVEALIQLPAQISGCAIPIHLLADLSAPTKYFVRPSGFCRNLKMPGACLVVGGMIGPWHNWDLLAGDHLRSGFGTMTTQEIRMPVANRCQPVDVSVDVDRPTADLPKVKNPTEVKHTCIGELRF
jgi:hypothetical protein